MSLSHESAHYIYHPCHCICLFKPFQIQSLVLILLYGLTGCKMPSYLFTSLGIDDVYLVICMAVTGVGRVPDVDAYLLQPSCKCMFVDQTYFTAHTAHNIFVELGGILCTNCYQWDTQK